MMNYVVSFDAVASISSGASSAVWTLLLSFLNAALVFISISPSIPPLLAHSAVSFKSICRSGANPEKTLGIRGGAMQVYHHNQ